MNKLGTVLGLILLAAGLPSAVAPVDGAVASVDAPSTRSGPSIQTPSVAGNDRSSTVALRAEEESPVPHWKQLGSIGAPSPRFRALIVYQADLQRTLLWGGFLESGEYCNETWEFDGRSWKQLDVSSPPAYPGCAMAYDTYRGVAVLYGGQRRDTWEFDGSEWSRARCNNHPSVTGYGAMAYDPERRLTVFFGGETVSGQTGLPGALSAETWLYDGSEWMPVDAIGPSPRKYCRMVYDSARRRVVLFGGFDGRMLNDTWEFDGERWRRVELREAPSPRRGCALTYDPVGRRVLLFGGYPGGDELWCFDGDRWSRIMASRMPPFREDAALLYVPTTERVLLFGGLAGRALNDAWELIRAASAPPLQLPPPVPFPTTTTVGIGEAPSSPTRNPTEVLVPPVIAPTPGPTTADIDAPTTASEPEVLPTDPLTTPSIPENPPIDVPTSAAKPAANDVDRITSVSHLADLYFENVEIYPRTLTPNTTLSCRGMLRNGGGADAACWIEFWISPTLDPFVRSAFLCRSIKVKVEAGQEYSLSQIVRLPDVDIPIGKFYIGLEVDRPNDVLEQDEKNNLFLIRTPYDLFRAR